MTAKTAMDRLMRQGRTIFAWALATVRATLPDAVRKFGQFPDAILYRLEPGTDPVATGLRLRSILGATTRAAATARMAGTAAQIELPEADQYRRILDVSEGAARRGRPALELRLHEFSPIPVEEAEFDFRLLPPVSNNGFQVEVSVVRRTRLQQAIDAVPGDATRWSIVGAVDADGKPGFRYASGASSRAPGLLGAGPGLVAVLAACVLVCLAWSDRFSRQAETLELRRVELIGFARDLRDANLDIERADRARQAGAATIRLGRVVAALRELGLRQPAGLSIRTITLDPQGMLVIDGPESDVEGQAASARIQLPLEGAP